MLTAELVHFYPNNEPFPGGPRDCDQPLAGLVLRDNGDSTVALKVFAPNGEDFYRSRVIVTDRETAKTMPVSACCLADQPVNRVAATPVVAGLGNALGGEGGQSSGPAGTQPPPYVPPAGEEGGGEGGQPPAETPPAAPTEPAGESAAPTAAETSPATNAGVAAG